MRKSLAVGYALNILLFQANTISLNIYFWFHDKYLRIYHFISLKSEIEIIIEILRSWIFLMILSFKIFLERLLFVKEILFTIIYVYCGMEEQYFACHTNVAISKTVIYLLKFNLAEFRFVLAGVWHLWPYIPVPVTQWTCIIFQLLSTLLNVQPTNYVIILYFICNKVIVFEHFFLFCFYVLILLFRFWKLFCGSSSAEDCFSIRQNFNYLACHPNFFSNMSHVIIEYSMSRRYEHFWNSLFRHLWVYLNLFLQVKNVYAVP